MGKKIAGICYIKADDIQFEVEGSVECPLSATIREPVESLSNETGNFSEKGVAQYVKLSALLDPDLDLEKLTSSTELTVTAELANGWVYTLTEAYLSGDASAKGEEGKVDLTFSGRKGVWKQ